MTQLSPLRKLARAYSDGKIEKDKYRTDRTAFFEDLIAGNVILPVEDNTAEKIARGDTFSDITLQKIGESSSQPAPTNPAQSKGLLDNKPVVFGGIGAIVVIVLLVAIFSGGDDTSIQPNQSQNDAGPAPVVVEDAPPSPLENHISSFLAANTWSEASLNAFLNEWQSFADADHASAMSSTAFSQLVNEISKKLLEERALAAIGNPETSYEKQRQLVEFANTIGIADQRITLPDAP